MIILAEQAASNSQYPDVLESGCLLPPQGRYVGFALVQLLRWCGLFLCSLHDLTEVPVVGFLRLADNCPAIAWGQICTYHIWPH